MYNRGGVACITSKLHPPVVVDPAAEPVLLQVAAARLKVTRALWAFAPFVFGAWLQTGQTAIKYMPVVGGAAMASEVRV